MQTTDRRWVSVEEAGRDVGVPVTTIRDWYRSGAVDTVAHPSGRVVDLEQVRRRAMGFVAGEEAERRRLGSTGADRLALTAADPDELSRTIGELRDLARERLA